MNIETINQTFTNIELLEYGFVKHYFRKNSKKHHYTFIINKNKSINTNVLSDGDYNELTNLRVTLFKY